MLGVGERVILTLWVGSLWTIGYIVAPTLFVLLDRSVAGEIAGRLFAIEAWLSLACGVLLIAAYLWDPDRRFPRNGRLTVMLIMVATILANEWLLGTALRRADELAAMTDSLFAWLHGLSAVLYLAVSVLGLYLVASSRSANSPED